jgi:hypothetical protein
VRTSCFTGSAYGGDNVVSAEAAASTGRRPDYSQGASEDHLRGGNVPVENGPARTPMNALGKFLWSDPAASRALPRRAAWVYRDRMLASILCFASDELGERTPSGVMDGLGEPAGRQALDVQILESDQVESVDEFSTLAVTEIAPLCGDALVDAGDTADIFPSIPTAFDLAGEAMLRPPQLPLTGPEEPRVVDLLPVVQCGERFQPHVDADGRFDLALGRRRHPVVNEDLGVPARGAADDAQ